MLSATTVRSFITINKIGSFFGFFPFVLNSKASNKNSLEIAWHPKKRIKGFQYLAGISGIVFICTIMVILLALILEPNLRLTEQVFGILFMLLISGICINMLYHLFGMNKIVWTLKGFIQLSDRQGQIFESLGYLEEVPANKPLIILTISPLVALILLFPSSIFLSFSHNSPLHSIVYFYESKARFFFQPGSILPEHWADPIFFITKLISPIIATSAIVFGSFLIITSGQICLTYIWSVDESMFQYSEKVLESPSNWNLRVKARKFYKESCLMNAYYNEMTSNVFGIFYFLSIILITGITFSLIRFQLNLFIICLFLGIQTFLIVMLIYCVENSVDLNIHSALMKKMFLYMHSSRKAPFHKFWKSMPILSIWIFDWFKLEARNLLLQIFGFFIFQNVLNLLLTFRS